MSKEKAIAVKPSRCDWHKVHWKKRGLSSQTDQVQMLTPPLTSTDRLLSLKPCFLICKRGLLHKLLVELLQE